MPKVSIITPVYNTTQFLIDKTTRSIDEQTSKDFEWIIVDDGSTSVLPIDSIIRLGRNFGPSVARNVGFQISSGQIITYLDMGDYLSADRVRNLIHTFGRYDIEIMFSAYGILDRGRQDVLMNHFDYIGKHPKFPTAVEYLKILQYQNISIPMGVAHLRKPFVEVGGFQRGIVCGEDGILWRRMCDRIPPTKILFSDDYAGDYNINHSGQSRTQRRFEMGGFAFDGRKNDNGKYLDEGWFRTYASEEWYE